MGAVTYFVRMIAKEGRAEQVQQLLLENPRRIEQGEPGNLAFGVHRSIDDPSEFGSTRHGHPRKPWKRMKAAQRFCATRRRCARWSNPTACCSATVSR